MRRREARNRQGKLSTAILQGFTSLGTHMAFESCPCRIPVQDWIRKHCDAHRGAPLAPCPSWEPQRHFPNIVSVPSCPTLCPSLPLPPPSATPTFPPIFLSHCVPGPLHCSLILELALGSCCTMLGSLGSLGSKHHVALVEEPFSTGCPCACVPHQPPLLRVHPGVSRKWPGSREGGRGWREGGEGACVQAVAWGEQPRQIQHHPNLSRA